MLASASGCACALRSEEMKNLVGSAFLMLVCASLGGYLSVIGAAVVGLPKSDWSLEPLVYLALGFVVGAVGFLGIIFALSFKTRIGSGERLIVAAPGALFLAFLSGVIGYPISKYNSELNMKRSTAQSAASNQRYERFYSMLRENPDLALRESWYRATDERRLAYRVSIQNRDVAYSPSMLGRLYELDDQMSVQLLGHTSFDASLLESEFQKALKRSLRGGSDCDKLQAILRNPNAKDEWFIEVASSGILEKGIFLCSDSLGDLIKRRHQWNQESEQAVTPNGP